MATSDSIDFTLTRNELYTEVLQTMTVVGAGETPSSEAIDAVNIPANLLLKSWFNRGIHLWTELKCVLFQVNGTNQYFLGNSQAETIIDADEASGQTVISVLSTTGIVAGSKVAIELDDGNAHLSTVASVVAGDTIEINDSLPGASSIGRDVWTYVDIPSKPANWTTLNSLVSTTLSADELSGQTVISLTSTQGMSANDRIGILLDSNQIHWSRIKTVDSITQATIYLATTGDASSGNTVYSYTNKAERPPRQMAAGDVQRRDESDIDIPVNRLSEYEYNDLSNKTNTGRVVDYYYDAQTDLGEFFTWLTPSDSLDRLIVRIRRQIEDLDSANDSVDIPIEGFDALVHSIAYRCSSKFGLPAKDALKLRADRDELMELWEGSDTEDTSIYVQPNYRGRR